MRLGVQVKSLFTPLGMHRPGRNAGQTKGQALIIFAFASIVLLGVIGLAIDGTVAYFYSVSVERAAAAGALAGAPFMPASCDASTATHKCIDPGVGNSSACSDAACDGQWAIDRAIWEATRNGFGPAAGTHVRVLDPGGRQVSVKIDTTVPTFFMQALGVRPFQVSRTAVAGYKPPISLGQPGNSLGSMVSQVGSDPTKFYFLRFKGWDNSRSEGDAYTPNPHESGGAGTNNTSTDVHVISTSAGNEAPALDCNGGGAYAQSCRGGYNYQITIPQGQTGEVDVYNAANSPDFNTWSNGGTAVHNTCENQIDVANSHKFFKCNANNYGYNESDNGSACPCSGNSGKQQSYVGAAYTLLTVPDIFLRSNDAVLQQDKALPIDATNWDGQAGKVGKSSDTSANVPSYINVNNDQVIPQAYNASGTPKNMLEYHAWMDVLNYSTLGFPAGNEAGILSHNTNATTCKTSDAASACTLDAATGKVVLKAGTYRLRVDMTKFDGSSTGTAMQVGTGSHGYSVRVIKPITDANPLDPTQAVTCAGCTIAGWEDMCVFTPVNGDGTVPLFQLPQDYAGSTILVDVYDLGDAGLAAGTNSDIVSVAIYSAQNSPQTIASDAGLTKTNNGISRFNTTASTTGACLASETAQPGNCVPHVPPQDPPGKPIGGPADTTGFANTDAGVRTSWGGWDTSGFSDCCKQYQGDWVRFGIPIGSGYVPFSANSDNWFWTLHYHTTKVAGDTFTFAVSVKGGPVHLISS